MTLVREGQITLEAAFQRISPLICGQGTTLSYKQFKRQMQHECNKVRTKTYKVYDWYEEKTKNAMGLFVQQGKSEERKYKNQEELAAAISKFQGITVPTQRISDRLRMISASMNPANSSILLDTDTGISHSAAPTSAISQSQSQLCSYPTANILTTESQEQWVEQYTKGHITRLGFLLYR